MSTTTAYTRFSVALLAIFLLATLRHVTGTFPRLCGEDLVEAVAFVCRTRGYYDQQPNKRSVAAVFQSETRAKSFLKTITLSGGGGGRPKRRVRTGRIVTECCINVCSVSILETYCNPLPEDAEHDQSVHVRHGKSAEEDLEDEAQGRPLDGPSQVDKAQGAASEAPASGTRGKNRVAKVEDALSGRTRPTSKSSTKSSSKATSSGRKSRKDKSARRKSSREAKEARREERRRQRERTSGGRSRGGNRKNKDPKDPNQTQRVKRQSLPSSRAASAYEGASSFGTVDAIRNALAPLTFSDGTTDPNSQAIVRIRGAPRLTSDDELPRLAASSAREMSLKYSNLLTNMRTFVPSKVEEGR